MFKVKLKINEKLLKWRGEKNETERLFNCYGLQG